VDDDDRVTRRVQLVCARGGSGRHPAAELEDDERHQVVYSALIRT
jgi:hypothetical protein